jgi:hypothetical protein
MKMKEEIENKEEMKMNAHQKLAKARMLVFRKIQAGEMKQSGRARGGREYSYWELDDIVAVIRPIFDEIGLIDEVYPAPAEGMYHMYIVNYDDVNDRVDFCLKYVEAEVGKVAIQNLGATESYLKRYLYISALGLPMSDEVENADYVEDINKSYAKIKELKDKGKIILNKESGKFEASETNVPTTHNCRRTTTWANQ